MKKTIALLLALCLLFCTVLAVSAAGGAGDPLASLSYLSGIFTERVLGETEKKLDSSDQKALEDRNPASSSPLAATWQECRLKQNDILLGRTGSSVLVLAGEVRLSYFQGAVIDLSSGEVMPDGSLLRLNHRYLVAEDCEPLFVVDSKTAVVSYQGGYEFQYSDGVDYNAMAAALRELHLFRGSFTGFGEGFDLEKAPTRLQALIMFIRVLGEEEAALAWSGSTPFRDLETGSQAEQYVGYAYEKGYTNGYSDTLFKPAGAVNAWQYTEFLLRALGHSSSANKDLSDTLERAQTSGLLTAGEAALLERDSFLRAHLVYLSYYALDSLASDGQRLSDLLMQQGVFTAQELEAAQATVPGQRIY